MPGKLLRDITASTLQVFLNYLLGITVFLLLSIYLPKNSYGELNWSIAVFTFANALLSLRLEQIVVKKTAVDKDGSAILTLYLMHVLITGTGFYVLLILLNLFFPLFFNVHSILLLVGISQLLNFISSPFKQLANGKERFDYLSIMSSVSNLVRVILLVLFILFFEITIQAVLLIFIISSFTELVISFYFADVLMKTKLSRKVNFKEYTLLIKESLPQLGVAILMAGITRMDWILLGFFASSAVIAEYSFAYRVYELSPFPLLIIAPVLLSRFSKYFAAGSHISLLSRKKEIALLVRLEMIVATMIPLILNLIWAPVINSLTASKYGTVNQFTFLVLSFCIPFQYISNIIWSAHFAAGRLKKILKITTVTFCIVLAGDLVFIPQYGSGAAAIVFLLAMIVEYVNYLVSSDLAKIKETWLSLLLCLTVATGSGAAASHFFEDPVLRLLSGLLLFFLLLLATRQLRLNDLTYVIQLVRKHK